MGCHFVGKDDERHPDFFGQAENLDGERDGGSVNEPAPYPGRGFLTIPDKSEKTYMLEKCVRYGNGLPFYS